MRLAAAFVACPGLIKPRKTRSSAYEGAMGRQQETKPTHPQRLKLPDRPMGCIICALVCPQAQAYASSNTSYPTHGGYLGCSDAYTGNLALTVRSRSLLSPRVLATEPVGVLFIGPARNQTATVSFGISVGRPILLSTKWGAGDVLPASGKGAVR